jgi:alpha-D-ribose 1-methylphosphonate 5-triphosphate synthase subunit PhnH
MTAHAASFTDPARQSQRVFRAAMMAMAQPGRIHRLDIDFAPPATLMPASAALALTLCDFETSVWLDPALSADTAVADWLRFETGARLTPSASSASFAFIADAAAMPALDDFALGTLENPDRSTTLVIQVAELASDQGWSLTGPGIAHSARLHAAPLRAGCFADMQRLRLGFPRGLDVFFVCGDRIAGLPRSVLIEA